MSREQYNRYLTLAAKYRQSGKNTIAEALERQAQAELEKPAMDVNDINMDSEAVRDKYNNPNEVATYAPQATQQQVPAQDGAVVRDANPVIPQEYKPTVEELQNQADSEQFNGSVVPQMVNNDIATANQADSEQFNIALPNMQAPAQPNSTDMTLLQKREKALNEINPKTGKPWGNDLLFRGLSGAIAYPADWLSGIGDWWTKQGQEAAEENKKWLEQNRGM